jgi:peptide/nickel transport system substrate-binding protein
MKRLALLLTFALALVVFQANAVLAEGERIFRLEEVPVGEIEPAKATDFADLILVSNIYDGLVWPKAGGGVQPHLAESWAISDDGMTYTFKLRAGIKFHDGSVMTADDVAFSMERMLTMKEGFSYLFDGWVESWKAIDAQSISITLSQSYAPFLGAMSRLPVVNKDLVMANIAEGEYGDLGDYGTAFLSQADAGSGAYAVKSHNKQDLTVMRRFDDYFLPFPANAPDEVRMRYGLEDATLRAMMSKGEHDVSSMWHPTPVYKALDQLDGISAVMQPQSGVYYVKINTRRAPTDNVHFRRAIALATDYDALAHLITVKDGVAGGVAGRGPIPLGMMGYDDKQPLRKRDLDAARAELAKANWDPDTTPAVQITSHLCCATHAKVALLLAANLNEIGVKTDLQEMPWPMVMESAANVETTPNLTPMIQLAATPDVDPLMYELYHSGSTGQWHNMEWLQNDEIDALLVKARGEVDTAKREAIYLQVNAMLIDLQPDIFLFDSAGVFAKRDNITLPFEDPAQRTGMIWADFNFRLVQVQ